MSPLTSNPINSLDYFKSPIETLLYSTTSQCDLSLHDVADAYASLSARIRYQHQEIIQFQSFDALIPFNENNKSIYQCLHRDMNLALVDSLSEETSFLNNSMTSRAGDLAIESIECARDHSLLCHSALRFVCDLFRFPALYSSLTARSLSSLLDSVLAIALSPSLPTLNYRKTWALALGILYSQALPEAILAPKKQEIFSVIERAIKGNYGADTDGIIGDGLKAVHTFLRNDAVHFSLRFTCLLPSILLHLVSDSDDLRVNAAFALGGIAAGRLDYEVEDSNCKTISHHVRCFIDTQSTKSKSSPSNSRLPAILNDALTNNSPSHIAKSPKWAVSVISSLIILLDASIFSHPRSLKLILPALGQVLVHRRHSVRSLQPSLWKLLVWAFSRLASDCQHSKSNTNIADSTFLVVKQELGGGIGAALVSTLLPPVGSTDTFPQAAAKAISVIDDMVSNGSSSTQNEGLLILTWILSPSVKLLKQKQKWDQKSIIDRCLINGSILQAKRDRTQTVACEADHLKFDGIRQLSETEIAQHWNKLLDIWIKGVRIFFESQTISDDALHAWESLMLAQAQPAEDRSHISIPPPLSRLVLSAFAKFLDLTLPSSDAAFSQTEQQCRRLAFVKRLCDVSATSRLLVTLPSEPRLATMMKQDWLLADQAVKNAWIQLCVSIVSAGLASISDIFCMLDERHAGPNITRQLWCSFAKEWKILQDRLTWQDGAGLISIPFRVWVMNDEEVGGVELLMRVVVSKAILPSVGTIEVIKYIFQRLDEAPTQHLVPNMKALAVLVERINLADSNKLPMEILRPMDKILFSMYPPPPELFDTALHIIDLVRNIIKSAARRIMPILNALRVGLCRWIEDESEILLDEEYNRVIMPLYCDSLAILRTLPPSSETLDAIAPFLAAAFVHIPTPALGPMAFESFWRATYHDADKLQVALPACIKSCLKAFDDAYGGDLSLGLSMDFESPQMPSSIIPDSQSPLRLLMHNLKNDVSGTHNKYGISDVERLDAIRPSSSTPELRVAHGPNVSPDSISNRQGAVLSLSPHLTALRALRDYSSLAEDSFRNEHPNLSLGGRILDVRPVLRHPFRSLEDENIDSSPAHESVGSLSPIKKRKIAITNLPTKRHKMVHGSPNTSVRIIKRSNTRSRLVSSSNTHLTVSEPTTRVTSPASQQPHGFQPRMLFDCVELSPREVLRQRGHDPSARSPQLTRHLSYSQNTTTPPRQNLLSSSPVNTTDWEVALSAAELKRIQRHVGSDDFVPDSQIGMPDSPSDSLG